jgi:ABC-type nitrate/sulfonate/bicarbonate transport system substrate-binding protein
MLVTRRAALLSSLAAPLFGGVARAEPEKVRLGQATSALSFIKIFAARALDSFPREGVALEWVAITGGDPPALAAVDSGDLDLAAVGSDTALAAIAKGQPFKIVYSLMSKLTLEFTVSNAFLAKSGLAKDAPLKDRIAALQTAVVGVSGVGGAQDRAVRWLAAKGGLDPKAVKVALVGPPPAIGAALENGRIDAFMLSPPESVLAEANGYGTILVKPAREISGVKGLPSLVLAAAAAPSAETRQRIVKTLRALDSAAKAVVADPDSTADIIQAKFFAKVPNPIIRTSVRQYVDGLGNDGQLDAKAAALLRQFTTESGGAVPGDDSFWTNDYAAAARQA